MKNELYKKHLENIKYPVIPNDSEEADDEVIAKEATKISIEFAKEFAKLCINNLYAAGKNTGDTDYYEIRKKDKFYYAGSKKEKF